MDSIRAALAIGDAGGIGPELASRILADQEINRGNLIVLGDRRVLEMGANHAGVDLELTVTGPEDLGGPMPEGSVLIDLRNCDPATVELGKAGLQSGRAAVENFRAALLIAGAGLADFVCFTPFNKQSMCLAKSDYVDEIGFIDETIGATHSGREFNILDEIWNARVTSHIPLRKVPDTLTESRIIESLRLTDDVMKGAGYDRPRIGVAALNPHAGDGRNFGDEDEDIILPAVRRAQALQLNVSGPIPADTVFVRALKGEFDAVLTMFHDQGQIAMKLIGFDRGVTLIAGYPFPIVTPAHGSAYDIAGQGKADMGATFNAVRLGQKLAAMRPAKPLDAERLAALPHTIVATREDAGTA